MQRLYHTKEEKGELVIAIRFVDFLFVTMRIFPFPQSLIYNDFIMDLLKDYRMKSLHF